MIRQCNCGCGGQSLGRFVYPSQEERLRSLEHYASELQRQQTEVNEEINRLKGEKA